MKIPYIVALGGTTRAGSSTEKALKWSLKTIASQGAQTILISGSELDLPAFYPDAAELPDRARRMICELRRADGIIIGTPGYHGGISGMVKNALDYTKYLRDDQNPYFAGRPVGCVTTAAGEQGAVTTLEALRSVVHALRGWPTPMGVATSPLPRFSVNPGIAFRSASGPSSRSCRNRYSRSQGFRLQRITRDRGIL
jgi:FMN reductase